MGHRLTGVLILTGCVAVLLGWGCDTASPPGPPVPQSSCDIQSVFTTDRCLMTLSGAVDAGFRCTPAYARYNSTDHTMSMVQIAATPPSGPVKYVNVTLEWAGVPVDGALPLVSATGASNPNSVIIGLNDPGTTIYQGVYDTVTPPPHAYDSSTMEFTVSKFGAAPFDAGGDQNYIPPLWCVNGHLSADTVDLTNPSKSIHLDLTFDGGI